MRVAVLGGGITGVCAALELSARGLAVDLYEQGRAARLPRELLERRQDSSRAGLRPGSFSAVGANDTRGSAALPALARAVDRNRRSGPCRFRTVPLRRASQHPGHPVGHRGSLPGRVRVVPEPRRRPGAEYVVPLEGWIWRPDDPETAALFSADEIAASYITEERSIDTFVVAEGLRSAAAASPNLDDPYNTTASRVESHRGTQLAVASDREGRTETRP